MTSKERKGVLILTEGRSGSNWLGSLSSNAGLGRSSEWLDPAQSGLNPKATPRDTYFEAVLDMATGGTPGFCVKIFPGQLHMIHLHYDTDFIGYCRTHYDVRLIRLTRNDRLRQAISFSRGIQTSQWTATNQKCGDAEYDFDQICRCYFHINRSYEFWDSYLTLVGVEAAHFVYEDLIDDPSPFINYISDSLGAPRPAALKTDMKVQRDSLTEDWLKRFKSDLNGRDFLADTTPSRPPKRTLGNILRLLQGRQLKPYPFSY